MREVPRRIVVCESDELSRRTISKVARGLEFVVIEAMTGAQALKALTVANAVFGFLDMNLPDVSAYEVARRLRASNLEHPPTLVAVADWWSPREWERSRAGGFGFYLARPLDEDRIVAILSTLSTLN